MHQNTQSQSKQELEVGEINQKLYDSQDIIAQMETRIKGLIFILDTFLISLEMDKKYYIYHKYIQDGISNLNILLDLLLEDNQNLEQNQEYIFKILKQLG